MYLVSNEEMRALDQSAIEEWHIPSLVLMENAVSGPGPHFPLHW